MATTSPKTNPSQPTYQSPLAGKRTNLSYGDGGAPRGNQVFLFDKSNYMWMFIGLACVLLGFVLMAGGKSPDPHVFNADEVFSARRITVAPILILIGFGIEAYAIMKKPASLKHAADEPVA